MQVGYISAQLGHHDATVTTGAYAKWAEEGYRRRVELGEQEVPADLLAHLDHGDAWAHATG